MHGKTAENAGEKPRRALARKCAGDMGEEAVGWPAVRGGRERAERTVRKLLGSLQGVGFHDVTGGRVQGSVESRAEGTRKTAQGSDGVPACPVNGQLLDSLLTLCGVQTEVPEPF